MAPPRLTAALLLFAGVCVFQMVATLGFVAPKTSVSARVRSEGFLGEELQGTEQRRGRSCVLSSRREMDATMRLGVSKQAEQSGHLTTIDMFFVLEKGI